MAGVEALSPPGSAMIHRMDQSSSFGGNRCARQDNRIEMCRFEVSIDHDDIRLRHAAQPSQDPFEIGAERIRGDWNCAGK